jgi:quercetin dioxygenase-like cupin family protein
VTTIEALLEFPDVQPTGPANETLARQAVALSYAAFAASFIALIVVVVLPNAAAAFAVEPIRVSLIPVVLVLAIAAAVLAWRWRTGDFKARRWLLLAVPGLLLFADLGPPLSKDFIRPAQLATFLISALVLLSALVAVVACGTAALEARRGSPVLHGLQLETARGAAPVAAFVVVVLLGLSGLFVAITARPGGGPLGAGGSSGDLGTPGGLQIGPTAQGWTGTKAAQGTVAALPDGTLYISLASGTLAAGASADDRGGPGIVYVAGGKLNVALGSAAQSVSAGEAVFVPAGTTVHETNAGSETATWYFLSVRKTSDKGTSAAASKEICASKDLPPVPTENQAETLFANTLAKGGRDHSSRTGGVEMVVGVSGTVEVRAGTLDAAAKLHPGQCVSVLEGTPIQVYGSLSGETRFLSFYLAPSGQPTSTDLSTSI